MYSKTILESLNAERRQVATRIFIGIFLTIALGILFFTITPFLTILTFFFGILGTVFFSGRAKYTENFKNTIVKGVFEEEFDHVNFDFEEGFSNEAIDDLHLVGHGNTFSSDDYISGDYHGVHFARSDINYEDVSGSGDDETRTTIFMGQWIVIDMDKKFKSTTKIYERGILFNAPDLGHHFLDNMDRIEMESSEFNKTFTVYTNNPHDAFYLLTPQMMEKIIELEDIYDDIIIGFIGAKMHILIVSQNMFEPPILKPIDDKTVSKTRNDACIIKDIIDILELEGEDEFSPLQNEIHKDLQKELVD